jgi:3-hydroxybutyryl-CoA dehydrogenase
MQAHPTRVAVVGSGYMGGGIAQVLALAGAEVHLADVDAATAEAARRRLIDQAGAFERAGLFAAGSAERIDAGLRSAESIEAAVAAADYVTEAVPEVREIKLAALERISRAAAPATVIGSNTSAIPIAELQAAVEVPERFLGVHWMNPAPFVPGVELIPTPVTDPAAVETARALLVAAGKRPAQVADSPGFVANRLQFALYREALLMVEEGLATAEQIDTIVANTFGFRLALFGPFAIGDMAGLDVYDAAFATLERAYGPRLSAPASLREQVAAGRLGTKAGGGFLDIPAGDVPPLLDYRDRAYAALSALRTELGAAPGLGA